MTVRILVLILEILSADRNLDYLTILSRIIYIIQSINIYLNIEFKLCKIFKIAIEYLTLSRFLLKNLGHKYLF